MIESKVQGPRSKVGAPTHRGRWTLDLGPWTSPRRGLTLIEVMMALAILGIGLTGLIHTASKCLAVVRQSRNYETARHLLGRVEVEHPLQLEEEIEAGTEEGGFDFAYANYRWVRTIESVGDEDDGLYSVRTRVVWAERTGTVFEETLTYLYAPEEKEGGSVVGR